MADKKDLFQYKQKTLESLQRTSDHILSLGSSDLTNLRTRFEYIDRYIARESDRSSATAAAKAACMGGDKTILRNFEPPIIIGQLDSAQAYFTEVYLSGYPIFGVVADKANEDQAQVMESLMARDSLRFAWSRELQLVILDTLRYNIGCTDVSWKVQKASKIVTKVRQDSPITSDTEPTEYTGNCIHRTSPYNTFWDQSVDPAYVPEDGLYAGYTEQYNYIKVRRMLAQLDNTYKIPAAIAEALKSTAPRISMFSLPTIRQDLSNATSPNATNWAAWFGNQNPKYVGNASGMYEVTIMYVRMIPKEYEIVLPNAATPRVFRKILLNGHLIYVEPLQNAHDLIPMTFLQAYDEGLGMQTKSFCENLMDIQDIGAALQNGRLKSLRRAVSDRGFYDPVRIRKQDIDGSQPDSKIAVKMNTYHKDLASAYMSVPYRDEAGATINQEFNLVTGMSSGATGVNQAMQGNFVKGNKTLHEYDDIANNGQSRLRKMAVAWESQFFGPLKHILRSNYLQYAIPEQITHGATGAQVQVDPVALRNTEMSFKISDGVTPSEKLINTQSMQFALQAFSQIPELAREYKTPDMAVSIIKAAGLPDLNQYKRNATELQAYDQQQQLLAQQAAQAQQGQPSQ